MRRALKPPVSNGHDVSRVRRLRSHSPPRTPAGEKGTPRRRDNRPQQRADVSSRQQRIDLQPGSDFLRPAQRASNFSQGILNNWADRIFDQIRMEAAELSIPDVLRQRVRTELVPTCTVQHPDFSYARPFPGGLSMILSIVHAAGTTRCTTEGLRFRPLGVNELFHYGQLNTDAITITITQKSGPTTCLSGPSPFIAAKAANMPAVIKQHAIEAPHGLFAIIPQQHLLFVAPATPDDLSGQLQTLVDFARFAIIDAQRNNPRHAVSRDIFYFSPEGACETVTCSNDPAVQELLSNPQISPANYHFSAQKYLSLPPAFEQRLSRAGHASPAQQNAQ